MERCQGYIDSSRTDGTEARAASSLNSLSFKPFTDSKNRKLVMEKKLIHDSDTLLFALNSSPDLSQNSFAIATFDDGVGSH